MKNWDPDGPGPERPMLVMGGSFDIAGNFRAHRIVGYRSDGFVQLPPAPFDQPVGLVAAIGPRLFIGPGIRPDGLTQWPGSRQSVYELVDGSWLPLGQPIEEVDALVEMHGELYAASDWGTYQFVDGQWDRLGSQQSTTDLLVFNGQLFRAALNAGVQVWAYGNWKNPFGSQVVGAEWLREYKGNLLVANGSSIRIRVGQSWQTLPVSGTSINAKTIDVINGDLYAGGHGGGVARFDGTAWRTLDGMSGVVCLGGIDGQLIAAEFSRALHPELAIARYETGTWKPLVAVRDSMIAPVQVLEFQGARFLIGGFRRYSETQPFRVQAGTHWEPFGDLLSGGAQGVVWNGQIWLAGGFWRKQLDGQAQLQSRLISGDGRHWTHHSVPWTGGTTIWVDNNRLRVLAGAPGQACTSARRVFELQNGTWASVSDELCTGLPQPLLIGNDLYVRTETEGVAAIHRLVGNHWQNLTEGAFSPLSEMWAPGGELHVRASIADSTYVLHYHNGQWARRDSVESWPARGMTTLTAEGEIGLMPESATTRDAWRLQIFANGVWMPFAPDQIRTYEYYFNRLLAIRGESLLFGPTWAEEDGVGSPTFTLYTTSGAPQTASAWADPLCPGREARLGAYATGDPTYQWTRAGVPLTDGPAATGSVIRGSATGLLIISNAGPSDAGDYVCRMTNACGEAVATVMLAPDPLVICPCSAADIASDAFEGADGQLTGGDFALFMNAFLQDRRGPLGLLIADLTDGSASGPPDGQLTSTDFDLFIQLFFAGC